MIIIATTLDGRYRFNVLRNESFENGYVIETINKNGKNSKRQVDELYDRVFDRPEEAIRAAEEWKP